MGATPLTATPALFTVSASCTYDNASGSGTTTEMDAIPVTYTGPSSVEVNGRDVIGATSDGTSFDASNGQCTGAGVCSVGTYVFSPVASYTFAPQGTSPIAPNGSLTAGQTVVFTVTALDGTSHPVPGAFIDLSLTTTASTAGTATGVNNFDGNHDAKGHQPSHSIRRYQRRNVCRSHTRPRHATSGVDTITAQNHPTETVEASRPTRMGAPHHSRRLRTPRSPHSASATREHLAEASP